jgi:hypothetical protein
MFYAVVSILVSMYHLSCKYSMLYGVYFDFSKDGATDFRMNTFIKLLTQPYLSIYTISNDLLTIFKSSIVFLGYLISMV